MIDLITFSILTSIESESDLVQNDGNLFHLSLDCFKA